MDPCQFARVIVGNLALKIPPESRPSRSTVHPSTTTCFCKIKLGNLPCQTAVIPLLNTTVNAPFDATPSPLTLAASFGLSKSDVEKLVGKSVFIARKKRPVVKVVVYFGSLGITCGGMSAGKLIGKVSVPLSLKGGEGRGRRVFQNGWVSLGKRRGDVGGGGGGHGVLPAKLHLMVMAEPDPRFVFEFDGEPECSPQVFQVQGIMRQPMFTCKFNLRNLTVRTPSMNSSRKWLGSFGSERERVGKERKGWNVTVHDLSGSPVALASMVTPFVAFPGSDHVNRSNPGAWLILRPGDGTWKPWGRFEAWRSNDEVGYRFELVGDTNSGIGSSVLLAESLLSTCKGGKFTIDVTGNHDYSHDQSMQPLRTSSPLCSPWFGSGEYCGYRGFVMSSTVEGEGKCSKPVVEIGVQNVTCAEDAAAFVALAAVVDLSMDACRLFSHKLRKELSFPSEVFL